MKAIILMVPLASAAYFAEAEVGELDVRIGQTPHGSLASDRADQAKHVEDLLSENDCWTAEEEPPVPFPGHVVYLEKGAVEASLGDELAASRALAQIFEGADHGLTVYGFCP